MSLERIAITGSSGFYGRALIGDIRSRFPDAQILGIDVTEPPSHPPDDFVACDVTDPALANHLDRFRPDTIVHLAFVVNPMRDEQRMHQINVDGTRNLLEAVGRVRPQRVLVSSSATAYGAWPDNPVPMPEDHPLRARTEYRYAHDKALVEEMLEQFAAAHPSISVSWTRPVVIYGEGVSNYLTEFMIKGPLIVLPDGFDTPMQFVHLEDVAGATLEILTSEGRGPFNIAPPDMVTLRDLARMSGRMCVKLPLRLCRAFTRCWWGLRLPVFRFPAGLWYFIAYPWVVDPTRLVSELNFQFRYSTDETLRQLLREAGKLRIADETEREARAAAFTRQPE